MKTKLFYLILTALFSLSIGNTALSQEEEILEAPEIMAEFPGGMTEMTKFISETLVYPKTEIEQGLSGRVFVEFVIAKDGSITDEKILKSASPELDNEALRVVKLMPKWEPAIDNGVPVSSRVILPITFQLN